MEDIIGRRLIRSCLETWIEVNETRSSYAKDQIRPVMVLAWLIRDSPILLGKGAV